METVPGLALYCVSCQCLFLCTINQSPCNTLYNFFKIDHLIRGSFIKAVLFLWLSHEVFNRIIAAVVLKSSDLQILHARKSWLFVKLKLLCLS